MKEYEVVYDVGVHRSREIVVKAINKKSARKIADAVMEHNTAAKFNFIRELLSVPRLEYEQDLKKKQQKIDSLEHLLNMVTSAIDQYRREDMQPWNGD